MKLSSSTVLRRHQDVIEAIFRHGDSEDIALLVILVQRLQAQVSEAAFAFPRTRYDAPTGRLVCPWENCEGARVRRMNYSVDMRTQSPIAKRGRVSFSPTPNALAAEGGYYVCATCWRPVSLPKGWWEE